MRTPRLKARGILIVTPQTYGKMTLGTTAHFSNSQGGTEDVPVGRYHIEICRSFVDDETGSVVHGKVLESDTAAIARLRKAGQTPYPPEHFRQYEAKNPGIVQKHVEAQAKFLNPAVLYFHASSFKAGVTWIEEEQAKPARKTVKR